MTCRWIGLAVALACATLAGGCGPDYIHQPLSLELSDPAQVAGAFTINPHDRYAVALEVKPSRIAPVLRDYVRPYFKVSFDQPLIAHGVVSRKHPGRPPQAIADTTVKDPDFSAWNSDAMTMDLHTQELPEGDYELRATLTGRRFYSEDYRTRIVVQHARRAN
ncbi:MAG: hypothetical protein ACREP7_05435 [Lysobacter sp.]